MNSAFGVDHGEIEKTLVYYKVPKLTEVKRAAGEMARASKKPVKSSLHRAPHLDRKDYVGADGVPVRWRGGK